MRRAREAAAVLLALVPLTSTRSKAVHENARRAARALPRRSAVLRRLVAEGTVKITVPVYDFETTNLEFQRD